MASRFSIYIGTDTRGRLSISDVILTVHQEALKAFPQGHSIREERGRWRHADGHAVTETTLVVSWMASLQQCQTGEAQKRVSNFAAACKNRCLQESVMIEESVVDCCFV